MDIITTVLTDIGKLANGASMGPVWIFLGTLLIFALLVSPVRKALIAIVITALAIIAYIVFIDALSKAGLM